jgi:hypothetical protein
MRLQEVVARRERWQDELTSVRRMHARVLAVERILAGDTLREQGKPITNTTVGQAFDGWCQELREQVTGTTLSETEAACLKHFLHVTTNMRPRLICCYDMASIPRTNNAMEGFIRSVKTRYRRISGRKNWNRYLLRYGRSVAYYEANVRMGTDRTEQEAKVRGVSAECWRAARAEQRACQEEQLKHYRFRHQRTQFLERLEARWAETAARTNLLP